MRGYFDEDEPEPEQPRRDTELTLGAGAVLGLVLGLVLVCGLCFGVGYAVGHHASARSAAANAPIPAPDQEPLQGNNAIPKPSAAEQTVVPAPQAGDSSTTPGAGTPAAGANPTTAQPSPAASGEGGPGQGAAGPGATAGTAPGAVRPALPAANTAPAAQGGAAPNVHAALPAAAQLMVQIAAVAHAEDANVLVAALRKRGYSVTAAREPADGLIHVRIGPFTSRDEANRWRDKLLGDGYNAVVQP